MGACERNSPAMAGVTPDLDLDFEVIDRMIEQNGREADKVMPILQAIQKHFRYLPKEALRRVCNTTAITPEQIVGVSTFYSQFRHRPLGRHHVQVCHGTACHVKGAERVTDSIREHLKIAEGEDTDADGVFTVDKVNCVGCCTLAPVVVVDEITYSHVGFDSAPGMLQDFLELEEAQAHAGESSAAGACELGAGQGEIRICLDSCCLARGCGKVNDALLEAIRSMGIRMSITPVSCVIVCEQTPIIDVVLPGRDPIRYARVKPEDVKGILDRHFKPAGILRQARYSLQSKLEDYATGNAWRSKPHYPVGVRDPEFAAFFGPQKHIALEHYGLLRPTRLDSYLGLDGFKALEKCLKAMTPQDVIEQVSESGLRGRGGGGFPTGKKWSMVRAGADPKKYVVLNGDEGDPGAFMDRMLMESFAFRVLEGMAIGAYAVGSDEAYCYVRAEYPCSVKAIRNAIRQCEERGLLGKDIMGTGFNLHMHVREGGGAFICGEETALMESIEGRRGIPRIKPPYPSEVGLWGKPTLINNVETFAVVPWIVRNGPAEFGKLGTEKSKGTKVFALAGKVRRGGLIEVPMGITIREIVEEIGGGIGDNKKFKAVQIGGPSGGCVPAHLAHTRVDYDSLQAVGAIMGSGGMIVLDENDCMVDIARYFLTFTQTESCGQCSYCRIGTLRLLETLTRLCNGQGKKPDLKNLEELAGLTSIGSICGLGRTAPNPVLSSLKYFPEEFEAHIKGECPAGKCKSLIKYVINERCIGCTICAQNCPVDAIPVKPFELHEILTDQCIECDTCRVVCPTGAVVIR